VETADSSKANISNENIGFIGILPFLAIVRLVFECPNHAFLLFYSEAFLG
jgi:hypothetical protein